MIHTKWPINFAYRKRILSFTFQFVWLNEYVCVCVSRCVSFGFILQKKKKKYNLEFKFTRRTISTVRLTVIDQLFGLSIVLLNIYTQPTYKIIEVSQSKSGFSIFFLEVSEEFLFSADVPFARDSKNFCTRKLRTFFEPLFPRW